MIKNILWVAALRITVAAGFPCRGWAVTDASFENRLHGSTRNTFRCRVYERNVTLMASYSKPVWLASKEQFAYTRKVTYIFFDKGGYVAQCKRYRSYIWPRNGIHTLKENAATIPSIAKMVGGVHIYVWDNARNAAFSKELKDSGIDKALFIWNPNHLPYPSAGYDDSLKAMGYAASSYELYTDENKRDTAFYDLSKSATYLKRNAFPGMFNQLVARKKDGTTYSNQFGTYTNPQAVFPEV
jgi:hypothetical protein